MATFMTKPSSGRPLLLAKPISLFFFCWAANREEGRPNSKYTSNRGQKTLNFRLADIPKPGPSGPGFAFWRHDEATDEFPSRFKNLLKTTCASPCTASWSNSRFGWRQTLEDQDLPTMGRKGTSSHPHGFTLGARNYDPAHMASGFRERGCT